MAIATRMYTLLMLGLLIPDIQALCDSVYTVGDDEFCTVSLTTFEEMCITFNASYNIAATNGLAIDPSSETIYIVASIGATNGNRELFTLNKASSELTKITTYSSTYKLSGITFLCNGELYGVTGSQNDHDLFTVNIADGSIKFEYALDASTKGTGIAYDPITDYIYRVAGTTKLDIEEIDYETGNITSDYFIDPNYIQTVRSIGYYKENYLFIIDSNEKLFTLDVTNGNVNLLHNLTATRKHKGIICSDYHLICNPTTTTTTPTTTMSSSGSTQDTVDESADMKGYGIILFVVMHFILAVFA